MCAAGTVLVLALAAQPLAAQANQNSSTASGAAPGQVSGVDESRIPLGSAAPAGAAGQPAAPVATPGVSTWDFVRMLLILACVIAVIYVLFWLLRKGTGRGRIQENDLIRVLGSRSLAGNRALHLVEVGSNIYLVGASDGGVELVAEITEKESLDSVRLKAAEQLPAGRRTFQQTLSEIFRPAKTPFSVGDGIGFLKGQRERLKKL
jgi:flagellar protein FliO/FliZ